LVAESLALALARSAGDKSPHFKFRASLHLRSFLGSLLELNGLTFKHHRNIVRAFSSFKGRLFLTSLIHQLRQSRNNQPSIAQTKLPTIARLFDGFASAKLGQQEWEGDWQYAF